MRDVERRLQKLESPETLCAALAAVVFYDAATGKPLAPIPPTATYTIWIPDNGREDNGNGNEQ